VSGVLGTVYSVMMVSYMCIIVLVQPISAIAVSLKYFTLVEEKEAVGLHQQVGSFQQL
jgi:hypothetical protein